MKTKLLVVPKKAIHKLFQLMGHCPYLLRHNIRHLKVGWSKEKIIRVLETL